jgi:hypothetical protein
MNRLEGEWIETSIVHARRDTHWSRCKVLNLLSIELVVTDIDSKINHIADGTTGMSGHEIREEVVPFLFSMLVCFKSFAEPVEHFTFGFVHDVRDAFCNMFRCDLEVPGDVISTDHFKVTGIICKCQIIPNARTDEYFFHSRNFTEFFEKFTLIPMTRIKVFTRRAASLFPTGPEFFPEIAGKAVHVCCRTTYVLNDALEFWHLRHSLDFPDYRCHAPALDYPALVVS